MEKPTQYLLVGFPYSGKSTLAKELQKRLGFAHINIDQLKFDRGYASAGDDDVPDNVWDEIFSEADKLIVQYLQEGKNVANEYAWITRAWRDRARNVAQDAGFMTKVIYLKLPREMVIQRWLQNSKTQTRFQWPEKEFEKYLSEFEEPQSDENIIIYDQTTTLDDWLKKQHPAFRVLS